MFIRIVRPMSGHLDGVALSSFRPGRVYRMRLEHAAFVLAIGAGEPVDEMLESADGLFTGLMPSDEVALTRYTGRDRRQRPRY